MLRIIVEQYSKYIFRLEEASTQIKGSLIDFFQ